jgi:hypothetical protein
VATTTDADSADASCPGAGVPPDPQALKSAALATAASTLANEGGFEVRIVKVPLEIKSTRELVQRSNVTVLQLIAQRKKTNGTRNFRRESHIKLDSCHVNWHKFTFFIENFQ